MTEYDKMPRAELIAELQAWENKFDDLIEQKTSSICGEIKSEYIKLLKLSTEEKYSLYWEIGNYLQMIPLSEMKMPKFQFYFLNNRVDYKLKYAYEKMKESYLEFKKLYDAREK